MKKRFEEDVISPAIADFLKNRGYEVFLEPTITLKDWPPVTTRTRFIRFDLIANKNSETLLVETKAASYPQLIGICVGEIQLYQHLLLNNLKNVREKGGKPLAINPEIKLICAFPDMPIPQMKWEEKQANDLFTAITAQPNIRIGLILAKFNSSATLKHLDGTLKYADITKENIEVVY